MRTPFRITMKAARESHGYTVEEVAKYCSISTEEMEALELDPVHVSLNIGVKLMSLYAIPLDYIQWRKNEDCYKFNREQAEVREAEREKARTANEGNRAEKAMSKADLTTYVVNAVMEEEECRVYRFINDREKKSRGNHDKAVHELSELVFSDDANRSHVDRAVRDIDDGITNITTDVGEKLYIQGFIEAAGLLGVQITEEDIQSGMDRENAKRDREVTEELLAAEAEHISKMFGVPVLIKVYE